MGTTEKSTEDSAAKNPTYIQNNENLVKIPKKSLRTTRAKANSTITDKNAKVKKAILDVKSKDQNFLKAARSKKNKTENNIKSPTEFIEIDSNESTRSRWEPNFLQRISSNLREYFF